MKFDVYGPFNIPYTATKGVKRINKKALRAFWREEVLGKAGVDLAPARGCYIFAIKTRNNTLTPWYVGKAENTPFGRESIRPNLEKYNEVLHSLVKRGTPVVFLLPQLTGKKSSIGKASKSKRPAIVWLERFLIGEAYKANPQLVNVSGTKKLRIEIVGVKNSDRRKSKAGPGKDLRNMLWR